MKKSLENASQAWHERNLAEGKVAVYTQQGTWAYEDRREASVVSRIVRKVAVAVIDVVLFVALVVAVVNELGLL